MPVGLRVDAWLLREYPDYAPLQRAAVLRQLQENQATFSKASCTVLTATVVNSIHSQMRSGKKLLVRDKAGDASKRKTMLVQSKDSGITTVNRTRGGAQLTLVNPVTHEVDTYNLPASGWKGLGKPPGAKGYQYKDRTLANGPCKTVVVKPGKLFKASCRGSQIAFSLNEASQGRPLYLRGRAPGVVPTGPSASSHTRGDEGRHPAIHPRPPCARLIPTSWSAW